MSREERRRLGNWCAKHGPWVFPLVIWTLVYGLVGLFADVEGRGLFLGIAVGPWVLFVTGYMLYKTVPKINALIASKRGVES